MRVVYRDADITDSVTVERCVHEVRESGRLPELTVEFDDSDGLWHSWGPRIGDAVSVTHDGAAPTGAMYVREVRPQPGSMTLVATPLEAPDESRTQEWRGVSSVQVAAQLADQLGLGIEVHGTPGVQLARFAQSGEGNLRALQRLCALTGALFDAFDGTAHLYERAWAEGQDAAGTLSVGADALYVLRERPLYGSCELAQDGDRRPITATAGDGGPVLRLRLDESCEVDSSDALGRIAAGLLAYFNAERSLCCATGDDVAPFAPAAKAGLEFAPAPSRNGDVMVARVRNDFAGSSSKIWWRPL